jgi:hypothetical protein
MRRLFTVSALVFLMAGSLAGQVPVAPMPVPHMQFLDNAGAPLANGCLFTYDSGTNNLEATYVDSNGTAQNTNPIILDAGGFADVWLANVTYRLSLFSAGGVKCATGTQQWLRDGINSSNLTSVLTVSQLNFTGPGFTLGISSLNGVLAVGGSTYPTMASCYAAIASFGIGGVCHVPPNYSETLSSDLVLSIPNAGFFFDGPATINMGANRVVINQGIPGPFIIGFSPQGAIAQSGGVFSSTGGVQFIYTGTGTAFVAGGAGAAPTTGLRLENLSIDLRNAGSSAHAIDLLNVNGGGRWSSVFIIGAGGSTSQLGISMDNGGGFTGDFTVTDLQIFATKNGILMNNATQEITFVGAIISTLATGGIGIDFEGSTSGVNFYGGVSNPGTGTAAKFGGTSIANLVEMEMQGSPTAVSFGTTVTKNFVRYQGTATPTVTDTSDGSNAFLWGTYPRGTATMTVAAIGANTCGSVVTVSSSGVLTTDVVSWTNNGSVSTTDGQLKVNSWPTANNVNFQYCNTSAGSITPAAATLNWKVLR